MDDVLVDGELAGNCGSSMVSLVCGISGNGVCLHV
jgi:hypothetical protein